MVAFMKGTILVYKVAAFCDGKFLSSCYPSLANYAAEYKLGQQTFPTIPDSKLFAFADKSAASYYMYTMPLLPAVCFECESDGNEPLGDTYITLVDYASCGWRNRKPRYGTYQIGAQQKFVLTDWLRPVRIVSWSQEQYEIVEGETCPWM